MFIVTNGNRWLKYKSFTFSGGEVSVKLDPAETSFIFESPLPFHINARISTASHIIELVMLVDAINRAFSNPDIHLLCPYLPYARQDRVCAPGESLSIRPFCDIINPLNFKSVTVHDAHSDVSLALLNNVINIPVDELVSNTILDICKTRRPTLVAPDAGSIKKVLKVAQKYDLPMIRADKIRDVNTGAITETVLHTNDADIEESLVVDDICDGGRTFIELGKVLSKETKGKQYLYVTHGIFSKGLHELLEWYDKIYCPNVFPDVEHNGRLIRI